MQIWTFIVLLFLNYSFLTVHNNVFLLTQYYVLLTILLQNSASSMPSIYIVVSGRLLQMVLKARSDLVDQSCILKTLKAKAADGVSVLVQYGIFARSTLAIQWIYFSCSSNSLLQCWSGVLMCSARLSRMVLHTSQFFLTLQYRNL